MPIDNPADLPLRISSGRLDSGPNKDGQTKRARVTKEQTIAVLKEPEAGAKTADLARGYPKRRSIIERPNSAAWTFRGAATEGLGRGKREVQEALTEQMLDTVALRELLKGNGRARRQARGGRAAAGRHEPVGTAGLLDRGRGSEDDPLSPPGVRRRGEAR